MEEARLNYCGRMKRDERQDSPFGSSLLPGRGEGGRGAGGRGRCTVLSPSTHHPTCRLLSHRAYLVPGRAIAVRGRETCVCGAFVAQRVRERERPSTSPPCLGCRRLVAVQHPSPPPGKWARLNPAVSLPQARVFSSSAPPRPLPAPPRRSGLSLPRALTSRRGRGQPGHHTHEADRFVEKYAHWWLFGGLFY